MLTGKRPFEGEDVSDVMGAVLRLEPHWAAIPADVPMAVQSLLRGCLVKERRHRVGDVAAALFALDQAANLAAPGAARTDAPAASQPAPLWHRALPWAVAAAAVVGLAAWIATAPGPSPPAPGGRFVVSAAPSAALAPGSNFARDLAISPDGTRVVYTSGSPTRLYVRAIDDLEGTLLRGTEGATHPFFSPDGDWIGFNAESLLRKVSLRGGSAQTLWSSAGGFRGASWDSDDTIVVATIVGMFRVPAAGGDAIPLLTASETSTGARFWPEVLPGGRALLFTYIGGAETDSRSVFLLDLATLEERPLMAGQAARYSPTGHILSVMDGTLIGVPFNLDRLEVTGAPVPLVEGVMTKPSGVANFDLASNGSLAYVSGSGGDQEVVGVDREGRAMPMPGLPRNAYRDVRVSPDGGRLAVATLDDVWTYDVARATLSRLTTDPANERSPLWSPDGARIVFTSDRGGFPELFWRLADGTGSAERLLSRATTLLDLRAHDWSPDGLELLFEEVTAQVECSFGLVAIANGTEGTSTDRNAFCDDYAAVSPDGRWVAYASSLTGRQDVYVARYPDLGDRQQVSSAGGNLPLWSSDGSELFFSGLDARQMLHVSVRPGNAPGSALVVGRPAVLFEQAHLPVATGWRPYDVFPDGRFAMIRSGDAGEGPDAAPNVVLIQHWFEELRARVPVD
jgi:serine/threonine-protein kinase